MAAAYIIIGVLAAGHTVSAEAKTQKTAKTQTTFTHPWQGKRVAYFGDSITDPNNQAAGNKYWNFLEQWLGIKPFVYAVS